MGTERFGVLNFTAETKAADFVNYLEQGKVMATRCLKCRKVYFPPRMDCSVCYNDDMEWIEITGTGKLVCFATLMIPPTGFEDYAPYTVAVVRFPDGLQVFGWIDRAITPEDVSIGMSLKVVPVNLLNDKISYHFEKA